MEPFCDECFQYNTKITTIYVSAFDTKPWNLGREGRQSTVVVVSKKAHCNRRDLQSLTAKGVFHVSLSFVRKLESLDYCSFSYAQWMASIRLTELPNTWVKKVNWCILAVDLAYVRSIHNQSISIFPGCCYPSGWQCTESGTSLWCWP